MRISQSIDDNDRVSGIKKNATITGAIDLADTSAANGKSKWKKRGRTYNYAGQIEYIPSYREAERGRYGSSRWFEQHAMRVHRLSGVLKRMRSKAFPIFHRRLILEELEKQTSAKKVASRTKKPLLLRKYTFDVQRDLPWTIP
jgi:hypothetical protein